MIMITGLSQNHKEKKKINLKNIQIFFLRPLYDKNMDVDVLSSPACLGVVEVYELDD